MKKKNSKDIQKLTNLGKLKRKFKYTQVLDQNN